MSLIKQSRLETLPADILLIIADHLRTPTTKGLPSSSYFALKTASTTFFYLLDDNTRGMGKRDKIRYLSLLLRDLHGLRIEVCTKCILFHISGHEKPPICLFPGVHWNQPFPTNGFAVCGSCAKVHHKNEFSGRELAKPALQRRCRRNARLWIGCPHDLSSARMNSSTMKWLLQSRVERNGRISQCLRCRPSLITRLEYPLSDVSRPLRLVTTITLMEAHILSLSQQLRPSYFSISRIAEVLGHLNVWICSHMTISHPQVLNHYKHNHIKGRNNEVKSLTVPEMKHSFRDCFYSFCPTQGCSACFAFEFKERLPDASYPKRRVILRLHIRRDFENESAWQSQEIYKDQIKVAKKSMRALHHNRMTSGPIWFRRPDPMLERPRRLFCGILADRSFTIVIMLSTTILLFCLTFKYGERWDNLSWNF